MRAQSEAAMPELKRPYPRIQYGETGSCGGNQGWFADGNFRRCGCGVVACADTLLYLRGRTGLPREEYIHYVNSLRKYFPLIPYRGIDGVRLAAGMNMCLRRASIPLRALWSASGRRFWDRLAAMLADDLPAILSIGPNFPRVWGAEELMLYRGAEDGGYVGAGRVKAHFLTATGLDGERIRVSSWGQELYIERAAYERYMRVSSTALLTNLLQLRRL